MLPSLNFRRLVTTFASLIFVSSSVAASPSRGVDARSRLTGTWQFNPKLSGNGRSELPAAQGVDAGDRIYEAAEKWSLLEDDDRTNELLEATELLDIIVSRGEVTLNATGGLNVVLTRTVHTDGRADEQTISPRLHGLYRSEWRGNALVVETELNDGLQMTEAFELNPATDMLVVLVKLTKVSWGEPVIIERVYDRLR
jgi:hypothetical protein